MHKTTSFCGRSCISPSGKSELRSFW